MLLLLKHHGFPWPAETKRECNIRVLKLLPTLFISLDKSGLIPPNFIYEMFYKAAREQFDIADKNLRGTT